MQNKCEKTGTELQNIFYFTQASLDKFFALYFHLNDHYYLI